MSFDKNKYLERIGIDPCEELPLTFETLCALQFAHVTTVPYENADIVNGIPLRLDVDGLFDKIVNRHRGGYCFELNGLYAELLRALGFEVTDFMARFLRGETEIPIRRHRVLCVTLGDKRYLCDVGIGSAAPRYPLLIEEGVVQTQFGETYKFEKDDFLGWVIMEQYEGEWRPFFSFTEERQLDKDYIATSFYCEKHPDSIFIGAWMLSIKTENGRKTLDGNIFKEFVGTEIQTIREIENSEIPNVMKDVFGIDLTK
ncbi:MAG: arylamine N-acetyltransferase [Clostridia bacterium]|nr:arylamine N-acetyltransferase [Clostridia bacterium]